MKKVFSIVTAICLILSIAGCSLLGHVSMEVNEMIELPDDEMIVALLMQLDSENFDGLNESQKVVYTAAALEMEVLNGGTVQFLANERWGAAPYVCEALEKIGATEHLALMEQALAENEVDLNDLSDFDTEDLVAFSKLYGQYNFDAFDSAYESLPSMPELIRSFIKAHMGDF